MKGAYSALLEKLAEIDASQSGIRLLSWDKDIYMPPRGAWRRAEVIGSLEGDVHKEMTSPAFEKLLCRAEDEFAVRSADLPDCAASNLHILRRNFERQRKLPVKFVKRSEAVYAAGGPIWEDAKEKSDFTLLAPQLAQIVQCKREEAEFLGYQGSPYDALIDDFEPGMTAQYLEKIFYEVREFLVPFLQRIYALHSDIHPIRIAGIEKERQVRINTQFAEMLGFSPDSGCIDEGAHPATERIHRGDMRIRIWYDEEDLLRSIMATAHEMGHWLYAFALQAHPGAPCDTSPSFGVDEASARLVENMICRSLEFWEYCYPMFIEPLLPKEKSLSPRIVYEGLNTINPAIRVDADEITYMLHIILRFEIEKDLIEGNLAVHDLRDAWNEKTQKYLDTTVPNDSKGVLQDEHWADGEFGYFPAYGIGSMYAAQLWRVMRRGMPVNELMRQGKIGDITWWLSNYLWRYGSRWQPREAIEQATGLPFSSSYFISYLREKYEALYQLT